MNVHCPECQTVYRIDPAKVRSPVRARCASCPGIITVEPAAMPIDAPRPPPQPAVQAEPERPAPLVARPFAQPRTVPADDPAPLPKRPSAPVFRPTPGMPLRQAPVAPSDEPRLAGPGDAAPVALAPAPVTEHGPATLIAGAVPANPFLAREPRERARRLARALVSDIIVYQPEKRRQALRDGTLKQAFQREIGQSWKEYKQQIGEEFAVSTPYFTEALNEILADGQQIF